MMESMFLTPQQTALLRQCFDLAARDNARQSTSPGREILTVDDPMGVDPATLAVTEWDGKSEQKM